MTTNSTVCTTTPDATVQELRAKERLSSPDGIPPTVHEQGQHTDPVDMGYDAWLQGVTPLLPSWFGDTTPEQRRTLWADHCLYNGDLTLEAWAEGTGLFDHYAAFVAESAECQGVTEAEFLDRLSVWLAEDAAAREQEASATGKTTVSVVAPEPVAPPPEPVYECTEADQDKALTDWSKHGRNAATAALQQGLAGLRYNRCRQALHAKVSRDVCIKTLVAEWEKYSDTAVTPAKVELSLLHAAVWELLGGTAKVGSVSGRVLRAWAPLVTRNTESRQEKFSLPQGHEALCQEQWNKGVAAKLTGEEHGDVVRAIQVTIATARRVAAEERWTANPCNATAQDLCKARKAELDAVAATAEKDKPAPVAPALSAGALDVCRKGGVEAKPETPATGTTAPAGETPAKGTAPGTTAAKPAAPAPADQDEEDEEPGTGTVAPNTDSVQGISPLAALAESAKKAASAPKATAEYCVALVAGAEEPDSVVEALLPMLADLADLAPSVRAALAVAAKTVAAAMRNTTAAA